MFRRVEHHMSTAITLAGVGIDDELADAFFGRVAELEELLSRFRPQSELCRIARGELPLDQADPAVRQVLARCEATRRLTQGDFEHEPRKRSGDPNDPVLDPNAYAKGWIIEDASTTLRLATDEFFINAGGDIIACRPPARPPWRIGIQHPDQADAVFGVLETHRAAVATSGLYERGNHIRSQHPHALRSVTVVGPDLAEADALATASFASGAEHRPRWWSDVEPSYGLLTLTHTNVACWQAPPGRSEVVWYPATLDHNA
jgi:thiamine biosynthesis lipoprotein